MSLFLMIILALNAGSSSLKYSVLDTSIQSLLLHGQVQKITTGAPDGALSFREEVRDFTLAEDSHSCAVQTALEKIQEALEILGFTLDAIGHRVVHGGEFFKESVLIDAQVVSRIRDLGTLAPLHNPAHADVISASMALFPKLLQVAVFDTAFHQSIPEHVYRYAVPKQWYTDYAVRRYGFHGTSHAYVSRVAVEMLGLDPQNANVIVAHLGNGCSATAVSGGKSVDTTMGLSPLEGLVMGTRSGNVDPNLHQYIANQADLSLEEITTVLNKESGLFGLSGGISDMRELRQAAQDGQEDAALAIEMFSYRLAKELMGLCVALSGSLDALVFTGGIGEHAPLIREKVCSYLSVLGVELDAEMNEAPTEGSRAVSREGTRPVLVIPTNEELEIALQSEEVIVACPS